MRVSFRYLSLLFPALLAISSCGEGGKPHTGGDDPVSQKLRCHEILYDAGPEDSLEWIELGLIRGQDIPSMAAALLRLEGAITYAFPDQPLRVGERIIVANDTALFRARYPYAQYPVRVFGPFTGRLNNGGEVVDIKINGPGDASCHYSPNPPWPALAAGRGHTLVYLGGTPSLPESYGASLLPGGNPGNPDSTIPAAIVRVNEIKPGSSTDSGWIELYNPSKSAIDLSGWVLSDNLVSGDTLPPGTIIGPNSYLLIRESQWDLSFYPAQNGDDIYLMQIINGQWTGVMSGLSYPALARGQSAGVEEMPSGDLARGPMLPTPGQANTSLYVGPLRISEIHFNPPTGEPEFLELVNISDSALDLSSPLPWAIEGIAFLFPSGAQIPPKSRIVLIRADESSPESFRSAYQLDTAVRLYPYTGKLSNRGELLTVRMPVRTASGALAYGWSDGVLYGDEGAWPDSADGLGHSLHRKDPSLIGEDPSSWFAAKPSPGY